jgi:ATP-dependent exoDNAse (exonuclease V) beta subunit
MTQVRSQELYRNLLIRASAGTGKTFRLAHRYLALVAAGEPVQEILAVTFARNAAAEITARVLTRLADAALDTKKLKELSDNLHSGEMTAARCRTLLRHLVRNLHRLRISTLDSFFGQLARHYSLELRIPPGWQVLDAVDDDALRQDAVQQLLELDDGQTARQLMHLIQRGDASRPVANSILSIVNTMVEAYLETPAAAWDNLKRAAAPPEEEIEAAITALANYQPTNKSVLNGKEKSLSFAERRDWSEFFISGFAQCVVKDKRTYCKVSLPDDVWAALKVLMDAAKASLLNQLIDRTTATHQLLDRFHTIYQQLKLASGGMTFADVPRLLGKGLSNEQVSDGALRLDGRLAHILIDEFQDTSLAQWQVVRHFAESCTAEKQGTLFCVGDLKQAIYGWRGGVAEVFDAAEAAIPSLEPEYLAASRRSSPPIIYAVNQVFSQIKDNPALEATPVARMRWEDWFKTHSTYRGELSGYVRLVAARAAHEGEARNANVLRYAAEEIALLSREHPSRTIAVLVRTNEASASLLQLLRGEHGIEASEEGGVPLTASPAVELILSLLKIGDHPANTAARFHVFHSPLRNVVGLSDPASEAQSLDVSRRLRSALLHQGYGATLDKTVRHLAPLCDDQNQNRLHKLVQLAYAYDARATERPGDFVEFVERQQVADPSADRIRVMTIHKAKGLQFDIVVLPELYKALAGSPPQLIFERESPLAPVSGVYRYVGEAEQSILPKRVRPYFEAWREPLVRESLCNLYVAMTRAVHALHIIVPPGPAKKASYAHLVLEALAMGAPADPEQVLFAHGDANWDQVAEQPAAATLPEVKPFVKIVLKATATRTRHQPREAPSRLEGGAPIDLRELLAREDQAARQRGTLFHAWLAEIGWLEDGLPGDTQLRAAALKIGIAGQKAEAYLAAFRESLAGSVLRAALSRETCAGKHSQLGTVCEVHRERPFVVRGDHAILRGSMDRLMLWRKEGQVVAAEVLDFKTDSIPNDAIFAERTANYRPQIAAYLQAVQTMYRLKPEQATGRLLFVMANRDASVTE